MPEIDYDVLPDLLDALASGRPVSLTHLRLLLEGRRPHAERAADFNRRIRDLADNVKPLGIDIAVGDGAVHWLRPRTPPKDRLLALDERGRATMAALGDAAAFLAGGADPRDDDIIGFGKAHVPRDIVRFRYGDAAESVQGRAARVDLEPPAGLVLDRNGVYERYRIDAVWDLYRLVTSDEDFPVVVRAARTIAANSGRPPQKHFYAGRGRGRPTATEMFRAMQRLGPLISLCSTPSPDEDDTRRLPVRTAEKMLGVGARQIETWANILGAIVDSDGDIVVYPDTPNVLASASLIDGAVALEVLLILRAFDALSVRWTELLIDTSEDDARSLEETLTNFLPHIQLKARRPNPTTEAIFAAARTGQRVDLHIDREPGVSRARIAGIVLRGGAWEVQAVIGETHSALPLAEITSV